MKQVVIENPVINSPYDEPSRHFRFTDDGITNEIVEGRRISSYFVPIAKTKKKGRQAVLPGTEWTQDRVEENKHVNEIRRRVSLWRKGGYTGVTPITAQLLTYWTNPEREKKFFFCQIEALETAIYITEVAKKYGDAWIDNALRAANDLSNPGLPRMAFKMATGTGKTVVMAMLMAWQALNKLANPQDSRFSDTFLLVAPCITIRDRLRPASQRPAELLPPARHPAAAVPGTARPGQDPHHQLPRLPPARKSCRGEADQGDPGPGQERSLHRDPGPSRPPGLPGAGQQEKHHRHQRRGPPLLPPQAGRRGREAHRRRTQGSPEA